MRIYRRIHVVLAALTISVGAGSSAAWAQPSPSPSPSSSPSPTPSASPSPSPSPSSSPSPSPDSTPPATQPQAGLGDLSLTVAPRVRLSQVGDRFRYSLSVANEGAATVEDVVVRQLVGAELTVAGVPILDDVEAINLSRFGDAEDITWSLGDMEPGQSFVLPWFAQVERAGDLVTSGSIVLSAGNDQRTLRSPSIYLASVRGLRVTDAGRAAVRQRVVSERSVTLPAAVGAPGLLPATGGSATVPYALVALSLVGAGFLLLLSPRRRSRALMLVCVLFLSACVGDGNGDRATIDPDQSPEVRGRTIERGEDADDEPDAADEEVAGPESPEDAPAEDEQAGEPDAVSAPPVVGDVPAPTTQIVREVRFVRVPVDELPVTSLGATRGDNQISMEWSDVDGVQAALSSIRFGDAPVSLHTALSTTGRRITIEVTLSNNSDDERLRVEGRILHEVAGLPGGTTTLGSGPVSIVLAPGAETVETFVYTLPTGSYALTSRFSPN